MGNQGTVLGRRQMMATVPIALGLLGCLGSPSSGSPTDDDPENTAEKRYRVDHSVSKKGGESSPVEFAVETINAEITPEQPAILAFSVTNTQETAIEIRSGPIPPFGVLYANASDGDGGFLLWSDDYSSSSHVTIENGDVSVADIGRRIELEPDEQRRREYLIRSDTEGLAPGEYTVSDVSNLGLTYDNVEYEVALTITAQS